ncbi:MAG TPA: hypothetical protein VGC13_00625 [Longimicrobium sp.]|jgi:hypothetical protein|uniref:hypothetical protein n=1 Tax=Longimicrobium sp. TaxID=2029185 RepID=UPI002ED7AF77
MRAPERTLPALAVLALAAALCAPAPAAAQAAARPAVAGAPADPALPETEVYRREVFRYPAGGRPDPFQPLLGSEEMGVRVQDLRLVSIVYSGDPRGSVATFTLPDSAQRVRLRVGQRLGSVTVVAIHQRRVDVREDEMGVSRVYSLELQRAPRPAGQGAPPAPAAPQPAPATPAGGRP